MFWQWVDNWVTVAICASLSLIFIIVATIKFDRALIRISKFFENNVEGNNGIGRDISLILLHVTPMIASFFMLIAILLALVAYNSFQR